jgi:AcrR family transcriptional regulator
MSSTAARPLRRDAERNRRRILEAAAQAFAERGLGITMDDIAEYADVGVGTVYRRFPNKQALIEALFEERMAELVAIAESAVREDDPWEALIGFIERAQVMQVENRGLKELMLDTPDGCDRVAGVRRRLVPLIERLVAHARASGELRPDVDPSDLMLIRAMLGAAADVARDVEPEAWRRMLAIVVDGLRAGGPRTELGAAAIGDRAPGAC